MLRSNRTEQTKIPTFRTKPWQSKCQASTTCGKLHAVHFDATRRAAPLLPHNLRREAVHLAAWVGDEQHTREAKPQGRVIPDSCIRRKARGPF